MKYEVLVDTFGFKDFYWTKGQIVEIDEKDIPPAFFRPLEVPVREVEKPEVENTTTYERTVVERPRRSKK